MFEMILAGFHKLQCCVPNSPWCSIAVVDLAEAKLVGKFRARIVEPPQLHEAQMFETRISRLRDFELGTFRCKPLPASASVGKCVLGMK